MSARRQETSDLTGREEAGRKAAAHKPKARTVAYAFSGSMADLPKAVQEGISSNRIQTFFLPGTAGAEDALRESGRFSRVRIKDVVLGRLWLTEARGPGNTLEEKVSDAQIGAEAFAPDARARAILRGKLYARRDLEASGGAYDTAQVRALLNDVTRQAVDKRVSEGSLLAVPGPRGARRFPTAQFDRHGGVVRGLREVKQALGYESPWAVLNFLVNGNDHLGGRRPIDALHGGEVGPVVAAAASVGVQGA